MVRDGETLTEEKESEMDQETLTLGTQLKPLYYYFYPGIFLVNIIFPSAGLIVEKYEAIYRGWGPTNPKKGT